MATYQANTPRAVVTAQALATMGADPEWDSRLSRWLRCQALSRANENFGPLAVTYDELAQMEVVLEHRFGGGWRSQPDAMAEYRPVFERYQAVEESISSNEYDSQTAAAVALALHPAPTLTAALFKVELIDLEELGNYLPMPRAPWEIVAEDMARFEKAASDEG